MRISFDVPAEILHQLLDPVTIPAMACVRYEQATPEPIDEVQARVGEALRDVDLAGRVSSRPRVAVAVGSRGVAQLPRIVETLIAALRNAGAEPFIVPGMGSHGGATAEGQREVLRHLGVTEETVGAPIRSQMETVVLGHLENGASVYMDRLAAAADAIIPVVRIKPHTAYHGTHESGLAKMIAIGLGKQHGAASTHARGFGRMADMVPAMAEIALQRAPIILGLAVLENAHDRPFKIVAVAAECILEEEPALLEEARAAMPRLPFDTADVLVIDRIGKNISGDGADPNVTGRFPTPFASGGPEITRQVVLDLADASLGNANGIGTADFTTARAAGKMSLAATYPNSLTSTVPGPVKIPMVLPSDELAMKAALLTCNAVGREPRVARIRDTLYLSELSVSGSLLEELRGRSDIDVLTETESLQFDAVGNIPDLDASGVA